MRHSKVRLRWDEDDAERDKVTRRALTRQEIDEGNFNALIASSSSESDSDAEKRPPKGDRDKVRKLLLNNDDDQLPEGWGGRDENEMGEGNLEITFRPALSGGAANEEETTLEKYKRKQKEKRKKKKDGVEVKSKEVDKAEVEKDDFFGEDSDSEEEKAERREATQAELELVAAPDDGSAKHFDMNAIVKEDKRKSKKGKAGRRKATQGDQDEIQENFELDITDSRFKAIHEDPNFAIDPSNPQCVQLYYHEYCANVQNPIASKRRRACQLFLKSERRDKRSGMSRTTAFPIRSLWLANRIQILVFKSLSKA